MKIIGFTIIVCLLIIELIFYYHNKNEKFKNKIEDDKNKKEEKKSTPNEIKPIQNNLLNKIENLKEESNDNIKPWYEIRKLENGSNEYILKVNNFNENKLIKWKELITNFNYDNTNNKISYITNQEGEALAIINLVLSNLNNDIELKEILDNNLLQISIKKAINHKLVLKKLKDLIESSNNKEINEDFEYNIDTYNIDNSLNNQDMIEPYIGKEYSLL